MKKSKPWSKNPSKGDYLIIEDHEGHRLLGKVLSVHGRSLRVLDEDKCHLQELRRVIDTELDNVVINLGSNPDPTGMLGFSTDSLYRGTKTHDEFGDIHFFYRPEADKGEALMKAFNISAKRLRKYGLHPSLNDEVDIEVYAPNNSSYSGYYFSANKRSRARIEIYPENNSTVERFPYVILHEWAHHLHFEYLDRNPHLISKWIQLYKSSILVRPVGKSTCAEMLKMIQDYETINAFRKDLGDDTERKDVLRKILGYIKANHRLSAAEVSQLMNTSCWSDVESIWPTQITLGSLEPAISDYALKSVSETVAEALSFYMCKVKLSPSVTKLVEKSISYIKSQFDR